MSVVSRALVSMLAIAASLSVAPSASADTPPCVEVTVVVLGHPVTTEQACQCTIADPNYGDLNGKVLPVVDRWVLAYCLGV